MGHFRLGLRFWGVVMLLACGSAFILFAIPTTFASTVYKCPGPPMLYTDAITAKEAQAKGCSELTAAPVTVILSAPKNSTPKDTGKVRWSDAVLEQQSRDADRKRILQAELEKEEQRLSALQNEYNAGEPERTGGEKNYQRYLDRVAEMKAEIVRKESDIAALKRELSRMP